MRSKLSSRSGQRSRTARIRKSFRVILRPFLKGHLLRSRGQWVPNSQQTWRRSKRNERSLRPVPSRKPDKRPPLRPHAKLRRHALRWRPEPSAGMRKPSRRLRLRLHGKPRRHALGLRPKLSAGLRTSTRPPPNSHAKPRRFDSPLRPRSRAERKARLPVPGSRAELRSRPEYRRPQASRFKATRQHSVFSLVDFLYSGKAASVLRARTYDVLRMRGSARLQSR